MNKRLEQLPLSLSHPTDFYKDDLVVTESNKAAYELIEHWPDWPMPIAVLVGPGGSGKTHFSTVWLNIADGIRIPASKLNEAITAIRNRKPVLIEDINNAAFDEVAFFHLINSVKQTRLADERVTLLITADTVPSGWDVKLEDLKSRLKSVTLAVLEQPDDQLLNSVAYKLFADRQISVDPAVIDYLISRCERSLFALGKAIEAIDRLALQRKSKVTKAIVAEIINSESKAS